MELSTQQHLVQKDGVPNPILVGHVELLGTAKQIIRLRDPLYSELITRLTSGAILTIFNRINPVNTDLIRRFRGDLYNNNSAKIGKIVEATKSGPVIAISSLRTATVLEMGNIFFEDIDDGLLKTSLISHKKNEGSNVSDLLLWISEQLYSGSISVQQIESDQRLFYRKICIS